MVKNADFVFSFNRLQARRFAKGYVLLYTLPIKSIGRITGTEITGTEINGTARLGLRDTENPSQIFKDVNWNKV